MARKASDFTVRVNLEGWHIRGHGTCWEGQEFQGEAILPRMIQALENNEKFKFQGQMAPVCVLRGGTIDELKEALGLVKPKKKKTAAKKAAPVEEAPAEEEPEEEPEEVEEEDEGEEEEDDEEEDEEDEAEEEDEVEVTRKPYRRPRDRE